MTRSLAVHLMLGKVFFFSTSLFITFLNCSTCTAQNATLECGSKHSSEQTKDSGWAAGFRVPLPGKFMGSFRERFWGEPLSVALLQY